LLLHNPPFGVENGKSSSLYFRLTLKQWSWLGTVAGFADGKMNAVLATPLKEISVLSQAADFGTLLSRLAGEQ
jgi:hypothetical protein